jgi:anti-sigma factor (TIGR02949 family)
MSDSDSGNVNVNEPTSAGLDCVHVIRRLWDYLDGRAPEEEREQIVAHLAWCAGCASHYEFEREFLNAVGRLRRGAEDYDEAKSQVVARLQALGFKP